MERILTRILNGEASSKDLDLLLDVANHIEGQTICALGDAAAWPVQSYLKRFREEAFGQAQSVQLVAVSMRAVKKIKSNGLPMHVVKVLAKVAFVEPVVFTANSLEPAEKRIARRILVGEVVDADAEMV